MSGGGAVIIGVRWKTYKIRVIAVLRWHVALTVGCKSPVCLSTLNAVDNTCPLTVWLCSLQNNWGRWRPVAATVCTSRPLSRRLIHSVSHVDRSLSITHTNKQGTRRAQTPPAPKCDPPFKYGFANSSGSASGCLPDRLENVLDSLCCRLESYCRVS